MGRWVFFCLMGVSLFFLSGCYQVRGEDDLRTVPVTNNPNIIPNQGSRIPSIPI